MTRASRDEVRAELDALAAELRGRLPRGERRAGWSRVAADAVAEGLEEWSTKLAAGVLSPRDVGDEGIAVRSLDAWGVDNFGGSPLARRVLDATRAARKAAATPS
jgi:hypothetical protein